MIEEIEKPNRWYAARPKDAVEYLELEILRHDHSAHRHLRDIGQPEDQTDATVTLPLDVARLVLACAQKGMRKGQGRRRPALSHMDRVTRAGIVAWARHRKAELIAAKDPSILINGRPSAAEAEKKAAKEACQFAIDRDGLIFDARAGLGRFIVRDRAHPVRRCTRLVQIDRRGPEFDRSDWPRRRYPWRRRVCDRAAIAQ
jgi:hypothetical protein